MPLTDTPADKDQFYSSFLNEGIYVLPEERSIEPRQQKGLPNIKTNSAGEVQRGTGFINGSTNSDTVLIFDFPAGTDIPPRDKIFLDNILKAVNLSLTQVAWGTTATIGSVDELLNNGRYKKILFFSSKASFLPSGTTTGTLFPHKDSTILPAWPLTLIATDVEKKKKLWTALKALFGL
jgi:hypothetical protein